MRYYELLVAIFEKEIGHLIEENRFHNEFGGVLTAKFLYQNRICVSMMFVEIKKGVWVIHHDFSMEEPFLLKKVLYLCERIERIGDTKRTTILLSEDLQDVKRQNIITTIIKAGIQNFFNLFTLFVSPVLAVQKERPSETDITIPIKETAKS
ncbi:hypothetical protein [Bacillus marasmi]|uniref:hypothetical protein n=1 Tax=Bacillus marasmi TaxID=1926279 RepID=UPI0011CB7388|nr:hypothetical protein [Bacillus marasmi]